MPLPPSLAKTESDLCILPSHEGSEYFSNWQSLASFPDPAEETGPKEIQPTAPVVPSYNIIDHSLLLLFLAIFVIGVLSSLHSISSRMNTLEARVFRLARDNTGRQDFALRYSGGRIHCGLTTRGQPPPSMKGNDLNPAVQAIDDDLRPGRCWLLDGSSGQIGIEFLKAITITHVTIDHAAKELISSLENAPRTIRIWGFTRSTMPALSNEVIFADARAVVLQPAITQPGLSFSFLGLIMYDIQGDDNIQTFPIQAAKTTELPFEGVVVEILDNWGKNSTCLYRVRVHGRQV